MILQGLRFRTKYRRFEISNERAASYKSDTINLHCVNIENVLTNRSNILQKAAYAAINLRPRLTSISCRSISPRLFPKANVVPFFVGVKYSIEVWRDKHRCTRQYRLGICEYTSIQVHFRAFTRGDSRHGVPAGLFLTLIEPSLSLSLFLFGKDVVTAVARCNDSGSLRKLPITLFYCMQVTERISQSGVLHDLPKKGSEKEM